MHVINQSLCRDDIADTNTVPTLPLPAEPLPHIFIHTISSLPATDACVSVTLSTTAVYFGWVTPAGHSPCPPCLAASARAGDHQVPLRTEFDDAIEGCEACDHRSPLLSSRPCSSASTMMVSSSVNSPRSRALARVVSSCCWTARLTGLQANNTPTVKQSAHPDDSLHPIR